MRKVQNKNENESGDDDNKIVQKVLQGASQLVQEITWGLVRSIKEEMGKALNYSDLFTSADVLDEEVKKVKEEITQVQSACSDNLSTLCIMQKLCEEGKDGEVFLKVFEVKC